MFLETYAKFTQGFLLSKHLFSVDWAVGLPGVDFLLSTNPLSQCFDDLC